MAANTVASSVTSYELVSPADEGGWRAYHDIRRRVSFEDRGRYGVYDEHHPEEHAEGNFAKLLLHDREPVGAIRIDIDGTTAIFRRVAVRKELQRQGHGRVLLALAEQFARLKGCTRLMSYVAPDSVRFYARCGFEPIADDIPPSPTGSVAMIRLCTQRP